MKDETISAILERLNRGDTTDIIIAPIGKNVFWGFVYEPVEESWKSEDITPEKGCEFFFVKSASGKFAAAAYRMGSHEIHWFVAKRYRRKKILVNPLKKIILPFIFAFHEQSAQRGAINLNNPSAGHSAKLAKRVGFQKVKSSEFETVFEIRKKFVGKYIPYRRKLKNLSEIKSLRNQATLHLRALRMILDTYQVKHTNLSHKNYTETAHSLILSLGCDIWMP